MAQSRKYLEIVAHYESCLTRHGDTHLGVNWPDPDDAARRYDVMLEVIRENQQDRVSLLDFGCGASHLLERIVERGLSHAIEYAGLDLSPSFIQLSRAKFPSCRYYTLDLLKDALGLPEFDYVIMNGVFTEKRDLSFEEMLGYFQALVALAFRHVRVGMAFNVMSKQVDWERNDLFHLPFDVAAAFLASQVSRHFIFRHDYRLYEYTAYVYR